MFFSLISSPLQAAECFILKEKGKTLKSEGDICKTRFTPQSTFKIPLSLMAFDSEILKSESAPSFPFKDEYSPTLNVCKGHHNAKTWMRDSCVWFSQELTKKMGLKKFKNYVTSFNYGNMDISGEHPLTHSWLNSSLKISPVEQTEFLEKVINQKFSLRKQSYDHSKTILFNQELSGGWKLYGKTGSGRHQGELQHGWFVGWMEKDNRKLVFAHLIADETPQSSFASFRSKNELVTKLWYVINELEK